MSWRTCQPWPDVMVCGRRRSSVRGGRSPFWVVSANRGHGCRPVGREPTTDSHIYCSGPGSAAGRGAGFCPEVADAMCKPLPTPSTTWCIRNRRPDVVMSNLASRAVPRVSANRGHGCRPVGREPTTDSHIHSSGSTSKVINRAGSVEGEALGPCPENADRISSPANVSRP